jgi:hypothetical protein
MTGGSAYVSQRRSITGIKMLPMGVVAVDHDARPGHRYRHHRHRSTHHEDEEEGGHMRWHTARHHQEAASTRKSKLPDMAAQEVVRRRSTRRGRNTTLKVLLNPDPTELDDLD